jgi:hypothetical protein
MFNEWSITAVAIIAIIAMAGGGGFMWKLMSRRSNKDKA